MESKVYVVGGNQGVVSLFRRWDFPLVDNHKEADIVVYTGGEDVWPELYDEKPIKQTHFNRERCLKEQEIFYETKDCISLGICRGGQLLNVLNGGRMWQDVNNHTKTHSINLVEQTKLNEYNFKFRSQGSIVKSVEVTSTHHQMMIPTSEAVILGYANGLATKRISEKQTVMGNLFSDSEILYYHSTKSLCFQPHPEYGHKPTEELFMSILFEIPGVK